MDWLDLLALDSLSLDWASRSYSDELACPVSCPCADTCLKHSWQGEATHISRTQALGAPPLRTGCTVRVSPQGCRCHRCLKHIFKPYLIWLFKHKGIWGFLIAPEGHRVKVYSSQKVGLLTFNLLQHQKQWKSMKVFSLPFGPLFQTFCFNFKQLT